MTHYTREIISMIAAEMDVVWFCDGVATSEPTSVLVAARVYAHSGGGLPRRVSDDVIPFLSGDPDWLTAVDCLSYAGMIDRGVDPRTSPDLGIPADAVWRQHGERADGSDEVTS